MAWEKGWARDWESYHSVGLEYLHCLAGTYGGECYGALGSSMEFLRCLWGMGLWMDRKVGGWREGEVVDR